MIQPQYCLVEDYSHWEEWKQQVYICLPGTIELFCAHVVTKENDAHYLLNTGSVLAIN